LPELAADLDTPEDVARYQSGTGGRPSGG